MPGQAKPNQAKPLLLNQVKLPLTRNQIRGFWAAWGGWALDGMDSFIYALVLAPALRELLPRSGISATTGAIGYYGGLLFALFLIGWGLSFLWGPIGDRFGRVRTLMLTILCYSVFTFLGAIATNVWMLAAFRLVSGIGIGGEWTLGGIFVAEEWPEERRATGAGYMHTGYYFGVFLAAIANYTIGAHYGWRAMFAVGGLPALLVGYIRYSVAEPERWRARIGQPDRSRTEAVGRLVGEKKLPAAFVVRLLHGGRTLSRPLLALFSREYRVRTLLNSLYLFISIIGLWAGSVYVPASVTQLAIESGHSVSSAARLASWATMLLSAATILGCLLLPPVAERFGRRRTLAFYFALTFASIAVGFGYAFYLKEHALPWFLACLFFLGIGGANFAMYTLWLPEQYRTECRASAFAFATSAGRFGGAGITFLVGAGVAHFQTIGIPVALTSIAFLIGLLLIPFGVETKGQPLPA
ncbi:MAG TPA: MFS transporter [Bryobacteraceae bacterium]|nr:MFS transporter [Bryobacteraceae bacterium]